MANVEAGTATPTQISADCKKTVCDGSGTLTSQNDDTDTLDDGKECTADTCNAGIPTSTPVAKGTTCAQNGGKVCDDAGACVECNIGADCASGVCQSGVCQSAQCGDGQKNGTETDVDCGGGACADCATGKACAVDDDCTSNKCYGNECVASVNGCDVATATDMTMSGTAIVTFANGNFTYAPKCLKVKAGTIITFNGSFINHPLQGGEVTGGMEVPSAVGPFGVLTNTGTTKDFTMSASGTFPYYCVPHGVSFNMTGAVFVVP